jgi:hypothetical protein
MDFVRRQLPSFRSWKWPGEANDMLYLSLDVLSVLDANWGASRARRILSRPPRSLIKTHWTDPALMLLRKKQPYFADFLEERAVFVHVVRHPLRVLESMWAWDLSQKTVAEKIPDRLWLEKKVDYWVWHTEAWMERQGILRIRFEDLVSDTSAVLNRLEEALGENAQRRSPLLPPKLRGLWHSRQNRVLRFHPVSTEILTFTKAATIRDQFADEAWEVLNEKAASLMRRLNYEA